jgi:aminoglycoside 2'-N-acetyltransferase I
MTSHAIPIRRLSTPELTKREVARLHDLMTAAFAEDEHGAFTDADWQHALGGTHVVIELDGRIAGHAAVVERDLHLGGRPLRTGYVEAVAIDPDVQGQGLGSRLMGEVNDIVDEAFEIGALGTGSQHFYERLGWEIWQGPSSVRTPSGEQRTPDEDGYILVRRTRRSPALRLTDPISCEWRPGDVW